MRSFLYKNRNILGCFLITLIVTIYCFPMFDNLNAIRADESWLQFLSYNAYLRESIVEFNQFPLWSPYFGGGYPFILHPENVVLSPLFILSLLFGEVIGLKLLAFSFYLFGALSMFYLVRFTLKYNIWGSIFSSLVYVMNSFLPFHIANGNLTMSNIIYVPLLLAFYLKAKTDSRFVLFSAFLTLFLLVNGMGIALSVVLLFLIIFSLLDGISVRGYALDFKINSQGVLLKILAVSFLFCALRLIPIGELLNINSRGFDVYSHAAEGSLTWENLQLSLFSRGPYRDAHDFFPDGVAADSAMYFGVIPCIFAFLSFCFYPKQIKHFGVCLVVFLMLSFGRNSFIDIYYFLWKLPIFHSLHYPNKYFTFFVMMIISIVAGKIFLLPEMVHRNKTFVMVVLIFLGCLGLGNMFIANRSYHENLFLTDPPSIDSSEDFYHVLAVKEVNDHGILKYERIQDVPGNAYQQYSNVKNKKGLINWYGNINLKESVSPKYFAVSGRKEMVLNPEYEGETFFLNKNNIARMKSIKSNEIIVDVLLKTSDRLIINQNYFRGWRSDAGIVENYQGYLSVYLNERGKHIIKLRYVPMSYYIGLILSLVSVATVSILFLRKKKNIND